jgi:hypothetical protein
MSKDGNFSYESFDEVQDDILELQREQTRLGCKAWQCQSSLYRGKVGRFGQPRQRNTEPNRGFTKRPVLVAIFLACCSG